MGARRSAAVSEARGKDVLTIEEAAELLGVSVKTFNKVLHGENVPGRKIGREWKFSRQALIDWIGAGRSDDFYREPGAIKAVPNGRAASQGEAPGTRRTSGWRVKMD
jgi:excisionase family DNA binding protein